MIAWAFSPAAKAMAERIEAQKKLKLQFVKLRLLPLESPEFAAHITAKHDRYTDLLSFVLPPPSESLVRTLASASSDSTPRSRSPSTRVRR